MTKQAAEFKQSIERVIVNIWISSTATGRLCPRLVPNFVEF